MLNRILAQGKNIRRGDLLRGNDILKALRYETLSSVEVHCRRGSIQSSSLGSAADPFRGIDGEQQRVPGHETHCVMCTDTRADSYGMSSTVLVLVDLDTIQKCMCSNVCFCTAMYFKSVLSVNVFTYELFGLGEKTDRK